MFTDDDVRACWDGNAETWTRHVRAGYDTYRRLYHNPAFFELLGDVSGLRLLDAGCGEGANTRLLARSGAHMTGIDISPRMIEWARNEEQREPLGIAYHTASMSNMACLEANVFDGVVSTMALMDCLDYEGAVREFWRVTRHGGWLAFSICHPCFTFSAPEWLEEDGETVGIRLTGDYFDAGPYEEQWKFGAAPPDGQTEPFTVLQFQRTLSDWFNPLARAGYMLTEVREPRPSADACHQDERLCKHRLLPHALMVMAVKPEMK